MRGDLLFAIDVLSSNFASLSLLSQFGLALIPFVIYHAFLICRNRTTLESMEGAGRVRISVAPPSSSRQRNNVSDRLRRLAGYSVAESSKGNQDDDEWKRDEQLTREEKRALSKANKLNIYNVGIKDNWKAVMGNDWQYWALPVGEPESDGYSFQINTETLQRLEEVTASIRGGNKTTTTTTTSSSSSLHDSSSSPNVTHSSPLNSVRGKARSQPAPFSPPQSKPSYRSSAHGLVEWGAPPKKDFVLYGPNDDDIDSGGVLAANPETNTSTTATPRDVQMDADVWS